MSTWLQNPDNRTVAKTINNYLKANNCSEEAQETTIELLQNVNDETEIDLMNEVKYEISQKCAKEVVKKVVNNSSTLSQNILNYFNQDKNYVIKYLNSNDLPLSAQGGVLPLSNCSDGICTIKVKLNDYMLNNSTDIFVAKVALHETIHALLVYLFESGQFVNEGLDPNTTTNPDYLNLVSAYVGYLVTNNPNNYISTANDLQHEYMTVFVEDMKDSLYQIGLSLGYESNSSVLQDDFLKKLVWSGSLEDSVLYGETFDFDEDVEIHNLGQAELHSQPQAYDNTTSTNNIILPTGNQINNTLEPCF